jgi:hypothetical protein
VLNEHYDGDGDVVFEHACKLGCEGIVSKQLGSPYRSGRSPHWMKVKNPKAPAVKREAEEDWGAIRKSGADVAGPSHMQNSIRTGRSKRPNHDDGDNRGWA